MPVSYVLKLRDVIVGRSDLAERDRGSRVARGAFRPGLGWDLVEPIFGLADGANGGVSNEQRARYQRARDTLALALYAPDGVLVESIRLDIQRDNTSPTGLVLDAAIVDDDFWTP